MTRLWDPGHPAWWTGAGIGLVVAVVMALTWPINYDESFNFLYYAERGARFVVTDYAYPNNHVLFTLVQSMLPGSWVEAQPLLLRVPNVLVGTALVALLAWDDARPWATPLKALGVAFAGPLALQYFGQARGFQLGTLLVAVALLAAVRLAGARLGWALPAVSMALASWTVPTFAFGVPIVAVYYLLRRDVASAGGFSLAYALATLGLYLPMLDQVIGERSDSFSTFLPAGEYTRSLLDLATFLPWWATGAVVALAVAGTVVAARSAGREDPSARALLFIGYTIVFLLLAEAIPLLGIAASPFPRNASFLSIFLVAGLWELARRWTVRWRWAWAAVLAVNVALGVWWWIGIVEGSRIADYPGTAFGQTPRLEALLDPGLGVDEARCAWTDEWTCRLYDPMLTDAGIRLRYPVDQVGDGPCLVGGHPPRAGTGIELVLDDGRTGRLCY